MPPETPPETPPEMPQNVPSESPPDPPQQSPTGFDKLKTLLPSIISLVLLAAAIWVIRQELQQYQSQDIWRQITAIPPSSIGWAIVLTLLNLLAFTGYDTLAARYIRRPLAYWQTALSGAIGIPVSNTVGLALLSSSAVRYRLYSSWNVPPLEIAQIIAFCNISFWLGLYVVAGILFVWQPVQVPAMLHLPFANTQPIGAIFLGIIGAYVLWNIFSQKTLRLGSITIPHLPIPLCIAQLVVASLDWSLAAAVLYALLPHSVPLQSTSPSGELAYTAYFGIYLLAQFAGVISNVPGGLGVFETVMLLLLGSTIPNAALFGSLIAYRAVYYLLPLLLAILLLVGYEVRSRQARN